MFACAASVARLTSRAEGSASAICSAEPATACVAPRPRSALRSFKHARVPHQLSSSSHALTSAPQYTRSAKRCVTQAVAAPPLAGAVPLGVTLGQSSATFSVWAPTATAVTLEVLPAELAAAFTPEPTPAEGSGLPDVGAPAGTLQLPLTRGDQGNWSCATAALTPGAAYRLQIRTHDGRTVTRRDPYALRTDYGSAWCFVDAGAAAFEWRAADWEPPAFPDYAIYELHVGSFTPEGTLTAAASRLPHLVALGITAVQLMPLCEHSDRWGYSPRQLFALHQAYGTPDEMRAFVDACHVAGIAVIVDIVLHHGAPHLNSLWDFDGWEAFANGGIYHENAPDTPWGRQFAFWKTEVRAMAIDASAMWLGEYRVDGLRFDSANDLPRDWIQEATWKLHQQFPGRLLTAEVTPENPTSITELGFDSVWVHSGYFDIIHQHRALGRGHHGGGDWAEGWDIPKLRTAFCMHYGFEKPHQCIKYLLGSHDQCGDQHGGRWYEDYKLIGGQHRYAVDQFGGGRGDPHARCSALQWHAANITSAGIPMLFMGNEWGQPGWWDTSDERRLNWSHASDELGAKILLGFSEAFALRARFPVLRVGWPQMLHEDRANGVLAFERVFDGLERVVTVVNAGRSAWQAREYGVWVGGGNFEQVYCSSEARYGGWEGTKSNEGGVLNSVDGKLWINLAGQTTLVFKQVYA
jgi:1,4-alpha-glucan branching enzyme